jgi:23S rRNA (uridine2552-2'-O)-methyltransferase
MAKSKSSKIWLKEHFSDKFVKSAQKDGFRSRAAYKLLAINEKEKLFRQNMLVVDLGAAPGGWSQAVAKFIGAGKIVAVDLLAMPSLPKVSFVQGDFLENDTVDKVFALLNNEFADIVISDMAPNLTGIKSTDQANVMELANKALVFAKKVLKPSGNFLIKVFQGEGCAEFRNILCASFNSVKICKPEASRQRSQELFLLAKNYKNI